MIYFLFIIVLCVLSLATTIYVMYLNLYAEAIPVKVMSAWVCISSVLLFDVSSYTPIQNTNYINVVIRLTISCHSIGNIEKYSELGAVLTYLTHSVHFCSFIQHVYGSLWR